MDRMSFNIFLL